MATEASERSWQDQLYRWLSAPLLVTIAGALLINLILPRINSQSQNHQRALEVKTALVRELSGSIADVLTTGRLVATDVIPKTGTRAQGPFNTGLAAWQKSRAELGSQIEAYFPHTRLAAEWSRFGALAMDLYLLGGTGVEERAAKAAELREGLAARRVCTDVSDQDWQTLATENESGRDRSPVFHRAYIAVDQCLLSLGDDLVRSVLAQDPSGL